MSHELFMRFLLLSALYYAAWHISNSISPVLKQNKVIPYLAIFHRFAVIIIYLTILLLAAAEDLREWKLSKCGDAG